MSSKNRIEKLEARPKSKFAAFEMSHDDRKTINDFLYAFMAGKELSDELLQRIDKFNFANGIDLVSVNERLESEC
jgi:hypothetical protein